MKANIILVLTAILFSATPLAAFDPIAHNKEYERIDTIASELSSRQKRGSGVSELIKIARGYEHNFYLRRLGNKALRQVNDEQFKLALKALTENPEQSESAAQVTRICALAYWKIEMAQKSEETAREDLLVELLDDKSHPAPHADIVGQWAVEELASRGVEEALDRIIVFVKSRATGKTAEERIWLCRTKIKSLSKAKTRTAGLAKALRMKDITRGYHLTRWAVRELEKENNDKAREALIQFAITLQQRHYGFFSKWEVFKKDPPYADAAYFYQSIVWILRRSGMSSSEIKKAGLRPNKYFVPFSEY